MVFLLAAPARARSAIRIKLPLKVGPNAGVGAAFSALEHGPALWVTDRRGDPGAVRHQDAAGRWHRFALPDNVGRVRFAPLESGGVLAAWDVGNALRTSVEPRRHARARARGAPRRTDVGDGGRRRRGGRDRVRDVRRRVRDGSRPGRHVHGAATAARRRAAVAGGVADDPSRGEPDSPRALPARRSGPRSPAPAPLQGRPLRPACGGSAAAPTPVARRRCTSPGRPARRRSRSKLCRARGHVSARRQAGRHVRRAAASPPGTSRASRYGTSRPGVLAFTRGVHLLPFGAPPNKRTRFTIIVRVSRPVHDVGLRLVHRGVSRIRHDRRDAGPGHQRAVVLGVRAPAHAPARTDGTASSSTSGRRERTRCESSSRSATPTGALRRVVKTLRRTGRRSGNVREWR